MITLAINERPSRCGVMREEIDLRHDGENGRLDDRLIEDHVSRCESCATYRRDLDSLRDLFGDLPEPAFPAEALDEVLTNTVDRPALPLPFTLIRRTGIAIAAAAVLTLSVIGAWFGARPATIEDQYTEAELVRMERDLNEVMLVLAGTMEEAQRVTVRDVIVEQAAPATRFSPLTHHPD